MLYHRDVLKAAALAVSTDAGTRPELMGVYLDGKRAVASDGHLLIAIDAGAPSIEEFPHVEGFTAAPGPVVILAEHLREACKATPRRATLPVLHCVAIGSGSGERKARIVATDLDRTHNSEVNTLGVYPAWEKTIPAGKTVLKTALGVSVVLKLFKALEAAGCETVHVDVFGPKQGWKIEGVRDGLGKVTALLMPCHRDGAE